MDVYSYIPNLAGVLDATLKNIYSTWKSLKSTQTISFLPLRETHPIDEL